MTKVNNMQDSKLLTRQISNTRPKHHSAVYRFVNNSRNEWRYASIVFENDDPKNHIIQLNPNRVPPDQLFSIQVRNTIYRWDGHKFLRMRLLMRTTETGEARYYLVDTKADYSLQEFNIMYLRNLPKATKPPLRKEPFIPPHIRTPFSVPDNRAQRTPKHFPLAQSHITHVRVVQLIDSSLEQELQSYDPSKSQVSLVSNLKSPVLLPSILKSPDRNTPSKSNSKTPSPRKVQFRFAENDKNARKQEIPKKTVPVYSFWLRACTTNLGKWGLIFFVLGLLGMIVTSQSSVLFYAAAATSIMGVTIFGTNLFRLPKQNTQNALQFSQPSKAI